MDTFFLSVAILVLSFSLGGILLKKQGWRVPNK